MLKILFVGFYKYSFLFLIGMIGNGKIVVRYIKCKSGQYQQQEKEVVPE